MALGIKSIADIEVGDILYAKSHTVAYIAPDTSSKAFAYTEEDIGEVLDTKADRINSEDYNNYIEVKVGEDTLYVIYDVRVLEFKANPYHDYPKKETSTTGSLDIKKGVDTLLKLFGVTSGVTNGETGNTGGSVVDKGTSKDSGDDPEDGEQGLSKITIVLLALGGLLVIGLIIWLLRPSKKAPIDAPAPTTVATPVSSLQGTSIPKPLKMT